MTLVLTRSVEQFLSRKIIVSDTTGHLHVEVGGNIVIGYRTDGALDSRCFNVTPQSYLSLPETNDVKYILQSSRNTFYKKQMYIEAKFGTDML